MSEEKNTNNQNEQKQNNNDYTARNDNKYEFNEAYDSKWITERGGTNNEPSDTPSERPHSNK